MCLGAGACFTECAPIKAAECKKGKLCFSVISFRRVQEVRAKHAALRQKTAKCTHNASALPAREDEDHVQLSSEIMSGTKHSGV